MRRLLQVLCALGLVLAVSHLVRRALRSPEERIRRAIAAMAEGFDAGRPGRAVAGLGPTWHDGETGFDRRDLALVLGRFFLTEGRDPQSGARTWRVEVPGERLAVELDPDDAERATARGAALFYERDRGAADDEWELEWELAFEGQLERLDGRWRFARTERRTLSGRRPRRARGPRRARRRVA